jgi:hypothetical protein
MSANSTRSRAARAIVIAFAAGTLLLSACGDTSVARPAQADLADRGAATVDTATAPTDFLVVRPGDRVDAFLGRSFAPSHWTATAAEAEAAIDQCVEAQGGTVRARPAAALIESAELRGTNLAEFRRRYGYGIVDEQRATSAVEAAAASQPAGNPEQAAKTAELETGCATAAAAIWSAALPPIDLVRRYDVLLLELAEHPDYLAVSERWLACMSENGYQTDVVSPYFAKGVVDGIVLDSVTSGKPVDYAALQTQELAAFKADAACLSSSGAGDVMMKLEAQILETLVSEFPRYIPPSADPAGLGWDAH